MNNQLLLLEQSTMHVPVHIFICIGIFCVNGEPDCTSGLRQLNDVEQIDAETHLLSMRCIEVCAKPFDSSII